MSDTTTEELLGKAALEAIAYTLQANDEFDANDAINFLSSWNEGDWEFIAEHYPDFDLQTPAQQLLRKESGFDVF